MNASFSLTQLYKDIRWFVLLNSKSLASCWLGLCIGICAGMLGIRMGRANMGTVADAMVSMFSFILLITPFFTSIGLNKRHRLRLELVQPSSVGSKYMARLIGIAVLSVVVLSLTFLLTDLVQFIVSTVILHKQGEFATAVLFRRIAHLSIRSIIAKDHLMLFFTFLWFAHSLQIVFTFFFKKFSVAFFSWIALWVVFIAFVASTDNLPSYFSWLDNDTTAWATGLLFAILALANYYWGYRLYKRIQLSNRKYLF